MNSLTLSFICIFDKKFTKVICGLYPYLKETRKGSMKEGNEGLQHRERKVIHSIQVEEGKVGENVQQKKKQNCRRQWGYIATKTKYAE